ncbi:GyrI-like domain-containing protein [Rhizobium sp.]|uniref:GyrI-like domain-containing protein n=1 Tax=Rhizobium sp. TaxID=391 RepID=UPI000DD78825
MLTMPKIITREPQRYVAVRLPVVIPFDREVDPAFDELFEAFAGVQVKPDGVEFIKFNVVDMPRLEIEIGMTTDAAIPLTGRLIESVLPAGRFVSMTYTGSYDGLYDATAMLVGWAKEKELRWDSTKTPTGETFACRLEVHDNNPSIEPDPSRLVTTLLFKLADA